ncbi:MAG: alpha/beta fold hydrolase [Hyphomicrobiaceae bacterium]|nr:MAG: alpha/beta fold hydrolase [Hyphomicrobiaceae bacterium]
MQASINGMRMNYEVSGPESAFPVVLHHPLATNVSFWNELTGALSPDYRVVRFDARGHGQTEAPKGPYSFETLTADVVALMDHLKIARAHFLGLSMGGMVGQYLGLLHADRFASLQLVSSTSRIPPEARQLWEDRVQVAREKGMSSQVTPAMQRWVTDANRQKPALFARLARMIETTPLEGYAGWCLAIRDLNITERLKAITLPTRIIVGAEDPATPVAASEVIHREIKGSDLIVMPAVSHMLSAEDPATFHRHVLAFLEKHPAR